MNMEVSFPGIHSDMNTEVSFPDVRILTTVAACPGDVMDGQPLRAGTLGSFLGFLEDPHHQSEEAADVRSAVSICLAVSSWY